MEVMDPGEAPEPAPTSAIDSTAGYAPESVNLVSQLKPDEQKKIAENVFRDYDRDWRSSEKYRKHRADILKLFLGELPAAEDGYAQIHYPLIAKAIQRLHARVYDQQFPSNGEFFGVRPTDATDLERCVRVAKHLNWQILHQIPEYVPNHDALIMQWYLYGSAFSYTYWDPIRDRPCHEACATEDIVLPYKRKSTDPNLADMPRITRVLRKYRFGVDGLDAMAESGYYDSVNVDEIFKDEASSPDSDSTSGSVQEATDRASGVEPPETSEKDGPRVLLEQHCWMKLPKEKKYRPVIVTIDKDTKQLLGLRLREDEDPEDRARYNREKNSNDASYAAAMEQYQADMVMYLENRPAFPTPDMTAPPELGETSATMPPIPGEATASMPVPAPPPQAPPRPEDPAPPRMIPINFFTHYVCIPNPEGVYGFGIGYLLEGNNIVADSIASIMVTSGKLSNTPTGLRSRQAKLRGGEFKIRPGEIAEVDVMPNDLDKCVHLFKFPGPEPQLSEFIRDQKQEAEELSGASDILSGEVGGSNETATTTQIRISQALAAISIQNKRYTRARTEEGKKFARLNSVHLGDVEYFTVVDPYKNVPTQPTQIGRNDYLEDVDITVTADPRMASQPQRFQEAMQAMQVTAQIAPMVPAIQQNVQLWTELAKNIYVAMDRPELVAALAAAPPPIPPQPSPTPPGGAQARPPQGPPPQPSGNGPPHPSPMSPGPRVPNAGPTPANGPQMGQGQ